MKRQHKEIASSDFEDYLKSIGCIFYAPMTYGDLTDHISGASLIDPSGDAVQWDDSVQMYLFLKKEKNQEKYFPVNLLYNAQTNPTGLQRTSTQGYTIVCRCKRTSNYTNSGYPDYVVLGGKVNTTSYRPNIGSLREETDRESLRMRFHRISYPNWALGYCDGGNVSNYYSTTINTSSNRLLSNQPEEIFNRVAINPKADNNDLSTYNCYVKDVIIFNRALSDAELISLDNGVMA